MKPTNQRGRKPVLRAKLVELLKVKPLTMRQMAEATDREEAVIRRCLLLMEDLSMVRRSGFQLGTTGRANVVFELTGEAA